MATSKVENSETSGGFVDNWQAGKTLAQCNLRMLNAEDGYDVVFTVGTDSHVIKAHRYILMSRSCVFYAMFSGPLAEKSEVNVPEVESCNFKQFLIYMYTDDTIIDADNVTTLLYLSRKYAITALEAKCVTFLETNLTVDNACVILEAAHRFDQRQLFDKAFKLVKFKGDSALQSPGFLALSQVLVNQILDSDDLELNEKLVFTAVNSWAEEECRRQRREVTPDNKRSVLGDTLMKVRFPLMETSFISDDVKSSNLLTDLERLGLLDYKACSKNDVNIFNKKKRERTPCISKSRYQSTDQLLGAVHNLSHAISFKSNTSLLLHGYKLYGNDDHQVHVTTYFSQNHAIWNSEIQARSKYNSTPPVFDVTLDRPIHILADQWYTLGVRIECKSDRCCIGSIGICHIECEDGVHLDFRDAEYREGSPLNVTSVYRGQFPALIYTTCDD